MGNTVRFARIPSQGVIYGIDAAGCAAIAVAVFTGLFSALANGGLIGILLSMPVVLPLIVLGLWHVHSQSLITYVLVEVLGMFRKVFGKTRHVARPEAQRLRKPATSFGAVQVLNIPGRRARFYLYETSAGAVVVWDALKQTATISCVIATPGLGLPQQGAPSTLSEDEREALIFEWSKILGSFTQKNHIERICVFEQTRPGTVAREKTYYEQHKQKENTAGDYARTLELASQSVVLRTSVLTVTFKLTGNARQVVKAAGSQKLGMVKVAELEIETVSEALFNGGFTRVMWQSPREWAAWGRSIIDPVAQSATDSRIGTVWEGVDPDAVSPMLIDEKRDSVETDSGFHRTFWIAEWPRYETYPGFMSRLVFAKKQTGAPVRHTFMLVASPVQVGAALKKIADQKRTWQTNIELKQKRGRQISAADLADWQALEQQEAELIQGQGELRFSAYLTVTSTRREDLETEAVSIRSALTAAALEPRALPWQQAEALLNVAYPAGLGMR